MTGHISLSIYWILSCMVKHNSSVSCFSHDVWIVLRLSYCFGHNFVAVKNES